MINEVTEISAFQLDPALPQGDASLLAFCPVRALRAHVARTQSLRHSHSQLYVCFCDKKSGSPVSKQCLSHWIMNTISEAYSGKNLPVLSNLAAHLTRCVATSRAALRGVPLSEICAAAIWSTRCTFSRFYGVSVASPVPLGSAVFLSAARRGCEGVESSVPGNTDGTSHPK